MNKVALKEELVDLRMKLAEVENQAKKILVRPWFATYKGMLIQETYKDIQSADNRLCELAKLLGNEQLWRQLEEDYRIEKRWTLKEMLDKLQKKLKIETKDKWPKVGDQVKVIDGSWAKVCNMNEIEDISGNKMDNMDWEVIGIGHNLPTGDNLPKSFGKNDTVIYDGHRTVFIRHSNLKPATTEPKDKLSKNVEKLDKTIDKIEGEINELCRERIL